MGAAAPHTRDGRAHRAWSHCSRGSGEINKTHFPGDKKFERSGRFEFWSEESGQRTEFVRDKGYAGHAISTAIGCEAALEIIVHLTFDLNVRTRVKSSSRTKSDKVNIRACGTEVEIIGEYTHRRMIVVFGHQPRRSS